MSEALGGPREKLLARVIDELDTNGLGERSLRDLAAAVGTSHRMLIHHFGSRQQLLVAVVQTFEAAERSEELTLHFDEAAVAEPADAVRATWARLSQPAMAGRERLFFECYARALQGEVPFDRLLPGAVEDWLDAFSAEQVARGRPQAEARALARLGLALMRGLLLDLLATGDRIGTTAALELFLSLGRDSLAK